MAVDMFLKLDGIKGESKDHKHKDEIHIDSWSWGLSQSGTGGTGGGSGAGKVSVHDISISKHVDKSSPDLMLHCCSGKHVKEGFLYVRKAGDKPVEYMKIKMEEILVSGVQHSGHGEHVSESVTLNFAKFSIDYIEQKKDGTGEAPKTMGWDVKANQKA